MACDSIAPSFKFDGLTSSGGWPVTPGRPAPVMSGDALKQIIGFTCNLGLGDQSSTLSIEFSGFHGSPESLVGKISIFKCNEFGFGGMIKSVVHTDSGAGPKTKIDMVDCKEALARYDVFMNDFHGSPDLVTGTNNVTSIISTGWNCKNVHRVIEGKAWGSFIKNTYDSASTEYGKSLPDINVRNCGYFGSATEGKVAQGSTTYVKILEALIKDGVTWYNSYSSPLIVQLGLIKNVANEIPYVGTSAKTMSLLDIINNVCEEAGYDWTFHTPEGTRIAIRLINKKQPTKFGEIRNKIEGARSNNKLISYSIGAEFKNEKTRRIVAGSKVNYIKEMYFEKDGSGIDKSAYVLGFDKDNWPILGYTSDFNVPINVRTLRISLQANGFEFNDDHMLKEAELLATGTMATWKLYGILNPNSISRSCMNFLGIDWQTAYSKVTSSFGLDTHTVSQACVEAVKFTTRKSRGELVYEEICYPWIKNFYDTFYGKYYMAILPKNTCIFDPTGQAYKTGIFLGSGSSAWMSDEPIDSGWADTENPIQFYGQNTALFTDGSGKTLCFCGIHSEDYLDRTMGPYNRRFYFEPSSLQGEWDISGNHVFTRAEADGRCYNFGSSIGILIKMPNMIPQRWNDPVGNANSMGLRMLELLIGDANGFSLYGGTTDFSYTNVFKETLAAGRFDRIAIPMKSNIMNYGPWFSQAKASRPSDGGVEFKQVEDLNPWSYGGYKNMKAAGDRIATDGLKSRQKYESGSITIAETPKDNMEAGGSSGIDPTINSIVCKIDVGGATTTYNYQTYVQKFGQSAEALNNYTKLGINARRANFNILKDFHLQFNRAFADGMRSFGSIREKLFEQASVPLSASSSSLNNILIMSYPDGSMNQRIEAGIDKKYSSDYFQDQINYSKYAIISLDMIFSPIVASIVSQSTAMPSMATPTYLTNPYLANHFPNASSPRRPPTRQQDVQVLPILNIHLNPYTNQSTMAMFSGRASGKGFDTEYISFGAVPANTFASNQLQKNYRDLATDIRGAALRGPLMLHSWGYDLNGDPVPGNGKTFPNNWLRNPKSWPCGPIDLRWDANRGVWVSPPSADVVVAELNEDLEEYGSAEARVFGTYNYDKANTRPGRGATGLISVHDHLGRFLYRGTRIIAYYVGPEADYIPIDYSPRYRRAKFSSCPAENEEQMYQNEPSGCLVGYGDDGQPELYSLKHLFSSHNLGIPPDTPYDKKIQHVLGFRTLNKFGYPCFEVIKVYDCNGRPIGDESTYEPFPPTPPQTGG